MDPILMLSLVFNRGSATLTTDGPYTSNHTWVAPTGVNTVQSITGVGAPGDAAYTEDGGTTYTLDTYYNWVYDDGAEFGPVTILSSEAATSSTTVPSSFCYPPSSYTSGGHYNRALCYYYFLEPHDAPDIDHPATTGASATGLSHTFPGGTGGAGSPTVFSNSTVTPGNSYNLVVPAGGSITLNYFR